MYCPKCHEANPCNAIRCGQCQQRLVELRDRIFIGHQFVFVQADETNPLVLLVDDALQTFLAPAILSLHCHSVGFGDRSWSPGLAKQQEAEYRDLRKSDPERKWLPRELMDLRKLAAPHLQFLTVVTDRKIYKPGDDPTLFVVAPDAAGGQASVEIRLADQKVYEARITLNDQGFALHAYENVREGEYTASVTLPGRAGAVAECTFSAAEFTLSPLIVTLKHYEVEGRQLTFELGVLLLSRPYRGPIELRLRCPVCTASRGKLPQQETYVVWRPWPWQRPKQQAEVLAVEALDGVVRGSLQLCRHDGPFHIEAITPDGQTASVALPNLGSTEREHIPINRLGRGADMSLAPWPGAQHIRGTYIGAGARETMPVSLEAVVADTAVLQALAHLLDVQLITFDPRSGSLQRSEHRELARGDTLAFDVTAPYTFFTVGAFTSGRPVEGWGVVIRPVAIEATLAAPEVAAPGDEIDVTIQLAGDASRAYCWLLAYDARLEHESPLPRLGKRIYESIRDASHKLANGPAPDASHWEPSFGGILRGMPMAMPKGIRKSAVASFSMAAAESIAEEATTAVPLVVEELATPQVVVSPARMEFPELVHNELFWVDGVGSRAIRLGQQIGTWRVRAYLLSGVDCLELTANLQTEKPVYAELDLPALASDGDDITASVDYQAGDAATLVVDTPFGRTEGEVTGAGRQSFAIRGPGRVEVTLSGRGGSDWSVRNIARPGVQRVTASRLVILHQNETVRAERAVVYAAVGHVLKDTITALIGYPFG